MTQIYQLVLQKVRNLRVNNDNNNVNNNNKTLYGIVIISVINCLTLVVSMLTERFCFGTEVAVQRRSYKKVF